MEPVRKQLLKDNLHRYLQIEKDLSLQVQAISEKITRLQADLIQLEKEPQ